jgi:hypothetical protein
MKRIEGVYARHPPRPNPTPCDKIRCVTLVENELSARERHMITTPMVDTQRATRGARIMTTIANGAIKYAMP